MTYWLIRRIPNLGYDVLIHCKHGVYTWRSGLTCLFIAIARNEQVIQITITIPFSYYNSFTLQVIQIIITIPFVILQFIQY